MSHGSFRYEATTTRLDRVIRRPRLTQLLLRRFENRLTTITAPAGSGKTTSLALAIESNRIEPLGIDLWLGCDRGDTDAPRLAAGLCTILDIKNPKRGLEAVDAIVAEIWSRAPDDIALILDDAHHLASEDACKLVAELVEKMPTNGHIVLAGRLLPPLPTARLRARHELLELGADELGFDDSELSTLIEATGSAAIDPAILSRLPAIADLHLRLGPVAGSEFLWEEVLRDLDPERLEALAELSALPDLDEHMVAALTNETFSLAELVQDLPLVEMTPRGRMRLHDLMRAPLNDRIDAASEARIIRAAATVETERGNLADAIELLVSTGDPADHAQAEQNAEAFVQIPMLQRSFEHLLSVATSVSKIASGSALTALTNAESRWGDFEDEADYARNVRSLEQAASLANQQGADTVESVSIYRACVAGLFNGGVIENAMVDRLATLAATVPYARTMLPYLKSAVAQQNGDALASLAFLEQSDDTIIDPVALAGRLCDLGRPEKVAENLRPGDLSSLAPGAETYVAFAMWLRGEVPPEEALPFALSMVNSTLPRGMIHPSVSLLGTTTFIAIAANELSTARKQIDLADGAGLRTCASRMRAFPRFASVALTSELEGDEAAATELQTLLDDVPIGNWPPRAYLLNLALLYALAPSTRDRLDACEFGAAHGLALQAARCLVSLREHGDRGPAIALDWTRVSLLRVHVVPHHLVELASAAATSNPDAERLLGQLAPTRSMLTRLAESATAEVAAYASKQLTLVADQPLQKVRVLTLGDLQLLHDGIAFYSRDIERRVRVRELFALLINDRRIRRNRAAELLWPDLAPSRALANLRVNLAHLQKVIEPSRDSYGAPHYLRHVGEHLVMGADLEIDFEEFDDLIARALAFDRAGDPVEALALYREGLTLYRGDFLSGMEAPWLEPNRVRLRSLAVNATCRIGELVLARGEPEQALDWAVKAQRLATDNERAARLFVSSLLASGDRAAAHDAFKKLLDHLEQSGLAPEIETTQLAHRLKFRLTGS